MKKAGKKKKISFENFSILRAISIRIYFELIDTNWRFKKYREFRILSKLNSIELSIVNHISTMIASAIASIILAGIILLIELNVSTLVIFIVFPIVLVISVDMNLTKKAEERLMKINLGLSEMIFQISILVSAGISIQNSVKEVYRIYPENSDMSRVLDIMYYEMQRGKGFVESLSVSADLLKLRNFNKFYNLLKMGVEKGMSNPAEKLMELAEDCSKERSFDIRKVAEKLSTKMLAPLMISLVGIMVMLVVPIALQL